ncbi:MAG: hypothetical protein RLZZ148_1196 [Cyanobacteriota bacterium]
MTNKTPLRDLIVILPGITGSVLQKDGEDFWGVSGQAIWDIFKSGGKTLEALKVKQDDPNASDLGDGVKAVRLVEDVQIIPGLFKVDGYTQTTKMFTENFSSVIQGKRSGQKGIGLSLDDLYLTNEPITLRAKVSEGASFNQLTAEITSVNSDRPPIIGNFTLENGTWVMATDNLAGGLYRVKVQTDNASSEAPNPVHDVFAVVNLGE